MVSDRKVQVIGAARFTCGLAIVTGNHSLYEPYPVSEVLQSFGQRSLALDEGFVMYLLSSLIMFVPRSDQLLHLV